MMYARPEIRFVKRINRQRQILLNNRSPLIYIANSTLRTVNPYPERRYPPAPAPTRVKKHPAIWAVVAQQVVPDVRGASQASAQAQLTARGFPSVVSGTPINSGFPVNTVATESPTQGTIQPLGTLITLVMSLGPLQSDFPNLIGKAFNDALVIIGQLPGVLRSIVYQDAVYPFAEVPRGTVLAQYPLSGSNYSAGVQVDLILASGYVFFPGIRESVANDPNPVVGSTAFP